MAIFRQRGRENNAKVFISDFETRTHNSYFIAIGNAVTSPVASVTPAQDSMQADQAAWNNMFFMNQLFRSDVSLMIKKIDWLPNTRYEAFNKNINQYELNEKFYAYNSQNNSVYLCLASPENENSLSQYPPTTQSLDPEVKADGYTWKFLYQVREESLEKFDYPGFLPIEIVGTELYTDERVLQQNVEANTVKGAIESIDVLEQGSAFPEVVNANFTSNLYYGFATEDTDPLDAINTEYYFTVDLDGRTELSRVANFYDDNKYVIHFKNGYTALIEESNSTTNPTNNNPALRFKICNLLFNISVGNTQFTTPPLNEPFCILPYIKITGNGSDAIAIPVFDSDKKITRISMLSSGKNYSYADAEFVVPSSTILNTVLGLNGLTSDVTQVLGAKHVMISKKIKPVTTLSQSDPLLYSSVQNTGVVYSGQQYLDVVSENTYYTQFSIIKNPKILNQENKKVIAGTAVSEIREMIVESIDPKVTLVIGTPLTPYTNDTNFFEVDDIIVRGPDSRPDQFQAKVTEVNVNGTTTTVTCDLLNGAFETYGGYRIKNKKNTATDQSDDEFFVFLDCEENCSNSIYAVYQNVFSAEDFVSDDAIFGLTSYKSAEIYPPLASYTFVNPIYPNRAKIKVKDAELGFLAGRYEDGNFISGETVVGIKTVLGEPEITKKGKLVSISEPVEILSETTFGYAYILRCSVNRTGADTVYDLVNEDGISLETNTIIKQPSTGAIGKIIRVGLPTGTDGSSTVYLYVNNYNDKAFTSTGGSSDILQIIDDLYDPTTAQNMNLYIDQVVFAPRLVSYSGDLLYINDAGPIQRRVENSENIKLLVEF